MAFFFFSPRYHHLPSNHVTPALVTVLATDAALHPHDLLHPGGAIRTLHLHLVGLVLVGLAAPVPFAGGAVLGPVVLDAATAVILQADGADLTPRVLTAWPLLLSPSKHSTAHRRGQG